MLEGISLSPRQIITALVVSATLGISMMLVTSSPAQAVSCQPGEFCLYFGSTFYGGIYHFNGSDQNLSNDRFEHGDTYPPGFPHWGDGEIVNDGSQSWWNRGFAGSFDDVLVYDALFYGAGATLCTPRGSSVLVANQIGWYRMVSSYKWVNSC